MVKLQDVLKKSRRLMTKQDVLTTPGKRRRIYDVLKKSNLRCLEDVQFRTFPIRLIYDVLRTSGQIYDVLKTSNLRRLEDL